MDNKQLAAQLREEIAATEQSIFFWNAQPDEATVFGFDIKSYRDGLQRTLENQQAALRIVQGK